MVAMVISDQLPIDIDENIVVTGNRSYYQRRFSEVDVFYDFDFTHAVNWGGPLHLPLPLVVAPFYRMVLGMLWVDYVTNNGLGPSAGSDGIMFSSYQIIEEGHISLSIQYPALYLPGLDSPSNWAGHVRYLTE